jgi:hypothetical protein
MRKTRGFRCGKPLCSNAGHKSLIERIYGRRSDVLSPILPQLLCFDECLGTLADFVRFGPFAKRQLA